ncbi:MAG: AraC family transcriptional regulator [Prevotella sp.]|nr:AraC family transcriptional regulator [Prevotella sp.]
MESLANIAEPLQVIGKDVLFISNLREVRNLPSLRIDYNTIVVCRNGRIIVEVGGNSQVRVLPGQMLLIPAGKLIQPMMISTDIEANALLISDKMLKMLLGSQINIWNKALYMKEIYVIGEADWLRDIQNLSKPILRRHSEMHLSKAILEGFLRMMLLLICEDLLHHDNMTAIVEDSSTEHDKELFNRFLVLLGKQQQKKQQVAFYADLLHITPKYLSTVCKRVSDKSPSRWITESVMQDSYLLLKESDLSVKEISNRLGFPNASFFGQYFREEAGMTPIAYRNKMKAGR